MPTLEVQNLHFSYQRQHPILKDLSFSVPEQSIYGFLGRNGAGKSTTIRNILGLLRPKQGHIHIFGEDMKQAPRSIYRRIGALIEAPSLYPNLSAQDHLRLACRHQGVNEQRIPSVLAQVGLLAARTKLSRHYSTGMKQRLGLAMALLHEPDLLILDEPINGLDPQGISDVRALLLDLQQQGKTILLSSHLLSEIEKIASHVGIIKDGTLLFEGDQGALRSWKQGQQQLEIRLNDPEQAKMIIPADSIVQQDGQRLILQQMDEKAVAELVRQLVQAKLEVYEVKRLTSDLEQLFMEINQHEVS
ncbi:MAG: ATP-binding cassette domain-containing protein [Bacteroidota bacterium]